MMRISAFKTTDEMGRDAASFVAGELNKAIADRGAARLILSTGASQLEMLSALTGESVDWTKVTMFHLDEYVALPESHPASFRKYLKERFVSKVKLSEALFVDGEGDIEVNIAGLTKRLRERPIDVAVVGIGENGHIAFNDPPADFDTDAAYMVVALDERCKRQQVGEGWFATVNDVPDRAISMTVRQIMKSKVIASVVPHSVKAEAVSNTLSKDVSPNVPATILKTHCNWNLWIDADSASRFLMVP